MEQKIWEVAFKYNVTPEELAADFAELAVPIAEVPGLLWKIWIIDEDQNIAGGIHLFEDQAALEAHVNSDLVAGIVGHPALSDFDVRTYDILEEFSNIARAPIGEAVTL